MENNEPINDKWWMSSDGSGNIALTVKGVLVGLVPVLAGILKAKGLPIPENDIVGILDGVFTGVSSIMVLIGITRKVYNKL